MDALARLLEQLKAGGQTQGHLQGFLHVLIGRRITTEAGTLVVHGLTWRQLSQHLKKQRWDIEQVRELGLDPDDLPPRDRQRFWYTAIAAAHVDGAEAAAAGERFAALLTPLGYRVGPSPLS